MRTIAIIKKCAECEKNLILSSVEKEDNVLFFDDEKEINKENINLFIFINCYSEIIKKAKS